jgi:oligoendopeptidase F
MYDFTPDATEYLTAPWATFEPYYRDLLRRTLDADGLDRWLQDWSWAAALVTEVGSRLYIALNQDTRDETAEARLNEFIDNVYVPAQQAQQQLKEKLLASGLEQPGFETSMRNIRSEAEHFSAENLELDAEELKLTNGYDKIIGTQSIEWQGSDQTLTQLQTTYQSVDRTTREAIWTEAYDRRLADRQSINDLWVQLFELRRQKAKNAGDPDYRAFRWKESHRFDYTPQDSEAFHRGIEAVIVPAATRIYERRRLALGADTLRPWDLDLDQSFTLFSDPPLSPAADLDDIDRIGAGIFEKVDAQLGHYYRKMQAEQRLDLLNRKGKSPGAYCATLDVVRQPFIFANFAGTHDDVQVLFHEAGHAFHAFEAANLPYLQQRDSPMEFAEVASMAMELLASPYLARSRGGYYSEAEAARAHIEHLEQIILFWPFMAVVDSFQHWAYTHPEQAADPARCDAVWSERWDRYIPGVDWSGLDEAKSTGWHRKIHILTVPFYYVEYGLAQLGACQVWRNSLDNHTQAVADYRQALALGGTRSLPDLFTAAGAKFAFDTETLGGIVELIEDQIEKNLNVASE